MTASTLKHRPARSWHKISVQADWRMTEAVAAYLTGLTTSGLEIITGAGGTAATPDGFFPETIIAYIPVDSKSPGENSVAEKTAELRKFLRRIHLHFPECPEPVVHAETMMEADWGERWKSFFTSFQVTPALTIKPSWEVIANTGKNDSPSNAVIEMDPGLAFGTGHHASTQLALLLLDELFRDKKAAPLKVLDVGTGSGILAMACGLFGASEVLALDNDPDAVETARQNILRNRLENRITVSDRDVSSVKAGFDLVVANITHDTIAGLALTLSSLINRQGILLLSGILKGEQEYSIGAIFRRKGLALGKTITKDEWAALQFHKK